MTDEEEAQQHYTHATTQESNKDDSMRGSGLPGNLQHFLSAVGVVNPAHPSQSSLPPSVTTAGGGGATGGNKSSNPSQPALAVETSNESGQGNAAMSPSIFESSLDLTAERLRFVFSIFDTDSDDRIDYDSLRKGLDFAGNSVTDEESFSKLIEHLDLDQSGDISFEEFCDGMRMLVLRDLYKRTLARGDLYNNVDIEVMDYNNFKLERHVVNGTAMKSKEESSSPLKSISAKEFYFQERPEWVQTRWIVVRNSAFAMQHLAVMYALHPLALEDAMAPDSHRAKAEQYSTHYFIMCPFFSILWENVSIPVEPKPHRRLIYAVASLIGWCLSGFPNRQQQRQQQQTKTGMLKENTRLASICVNMTSMFVKMPKNDTMILHVHSDSPDAPHLGQRVKQDLELSYSKLRQYDAQYLVYALLDEAVDALEPIILRVKEDIENEQDFLVVTHYNSLARIHHLKSELMKVSQKLKPFMRLLTHVIEDDAISPGATIYLRDVLDNLEGFDEDVRQLLSTCESVDDDADKFQSRQMDKTLYTLTVISAVFLPAQFLTGVWGMNFHQMPELDERWGYGMFWGISVFLMIATLVALNFGRLR